MFKLPEGYSSWSQFAFDMVLGAFMLGMLYLALAISTLI